MAHYMFFVFNLKKNQSRYAPAPKIGMCPEMDLANNNWRDKILHMYLKKGQRQKEARDIGERSVSCQGDFVGSGMSRIVIERVKLFSVTFSVF